MNDRNQQEMSRYVPVSSCHYLIDLDFPGQSEPHYAQDLFHWQVVAKWPFLDSPHSQNPFLRAFYVPKWSETSNMWNTYYLLKAKPDTQRRVTLKVVDKGTY